ncbi:MAG: signal peptidase I [Chloroflexi bacterium]|nr:signal peptidase I [Chloroflexota bacterium]
MKAFARDVLTTLIIAAVIFFGLQTTVYSIIVDGPSMNYSFHDGQRILVSKITYRLHEPQRGDVIILHPPAEYGPQSIPFIKRIIGLPGESVEIKDGIVYIHKENGSLLKLDEPYITEQTRLPFKGNKIPQNEYFVLGDNRRNSDDSRSGWTIPRQNIIGKAWISIWPPQYWGMAANYPLPNSANSQTENTKPDLEAHWLRTGN